MAALLVPVSPLQCKEVSACPLSHMVINPYSSKLLQIKVKVIPKPHARKVSSPSKNKIIKCDRERKNFTVLLHVLTADGSSSRSCID